LSYGGNPYDAASVQVVFRTVVIHVGVVRTVRRLLFISGMVVVCEVYKSGVCIVHQCSTLCRSALCWSMWFGFSIRWGFSHLCFSDVFSDGFSHLFVQSCFSDVFSHFCCSVCFPYVCSPCFLTCFHTYVVQISFLICIAFVS
jgi:hypothetical protein